MGTAPRSSVAAAWNCSRDRPQADAVLCFQDLMNCFRRTSLFFAGLTSTGLFSVGLFAAALLFSASLCAQQSSQTLPDSPDVQAPTVPQSTQTAPDQNAPDQSAPGQPATGQSAPNPSAPETPQSEAPPSPQPTGPTVLFDTTMGRITCKLFDKQAPVAVANFVGLATGTKDWTDPATKQVMRGKPFYNGTTFHRVIPGFMIQGGDPLGTGMGGPGYQFNDELDPDLNFNVPGRLAMANSGPNTNGSQFFITEAPADYLDQKYTIFGQCDDASVWIVKSIARVNRDSNDKPLSPVVLVKVTVIPAGQPVPASDAAAPAPTPQTAPQF